MLFRVINHGRGSRVIFNTKRQPVEIKGRSEKLVDLDDRTVDLLNKLRANKKPGSLEIRESAGEEIGEVFVTETDKPNGGGKLPPVNDLLSRIDKISAQQFRAEAKEILGDKWPSERVPNREAIINLLKAHEEGQTP
jgi:integrase